MDSISSSVWQRKGSCIVFDQKSMGQFITEGSVVSLREALLWLNVFPSVPPVCNRTVLISGLEAIIETLSPDEVEDFLRRRIHPLLVELQRHWTDCGIVFGFSAHEKAFEETPLEEEVVFWRRDRKIVHLSLWLWDGAAVNMKRITREGDEPGKEVRVGYHVARIS